MARALTIAQEQFVQNLIKGMSQRDAYHKAYPNNKMKDDYIDNKACLLFQVAKVRQRYDELLERATNKSIMSAIERKEWLTKLITDEVGNNNDRLKALDILNKMDGEYITKIDADVRLETIEVNITDDEQD